MTPEEAEQRQKAYRRSRMLHARKYGRRYSDDLEKPEPGILDEADEELG